VIAGVAAAAAWVFTAGIRSLEFDPSTVKAPEKSHPHFDRYLRSKRGYWLFTHSWLPDPTKSAPKALLFLVHGMGEHAGRKGYDAFARFFTDRGYGVFSLDHHGHGRSSGEKAYLRSYQWAVNDYYDFVQTIIAKYPNVPRFLVGHSMGGALALTMKVTHSTTYDSVVVFGAASAVHEFPKMPPGARSLLKAIGSILPKARLISLDSDKISRNPRSVADAKVDPHMNHANLPIRSVMQLVEMGEFLDLQRNRLTFPLFIIHGVNDSIVAKEQSERLFNKIPSKEKKLWLIPEVWHEVFEDKVAADVFEEVFKWVEERYSIDVKNYPK
jgi:alpha-beta hydrolase superfamily lysophospholipase